MAEVSIRVLLELERSLLSEIDKNLPDVSIRVLLEFERSHSVTTCLDSYSVSIRVLLEFERSAETKIMLVAGAMSQSEFCWSLRDPY